MPKKKLQGKVISDKMQKTVVVEVKKMVYHKKYKKRYFVSKKYKAQNEENKYREGDEVIIQETKPMSRDKRWAVVKKLG